MSSTVSMLAKLLRKVCVGVLDEKLTFSKQWPYNNVISSPFMGELQEEMGGKVHLVKNNKESTSAYASYITLHRLTLSMLKFTW